MLVIYQLYKEREDEYMENQKHYKNDEQAKSRTEPIFDIVQRRVCKFITLVLEKGRPTPIDWIYKCWTYGLKIQYSTTADGVLE